jgi:hypothetical protein
LDLPKLPSHVADNLLVAGGTTRPKPLCSLFSSQNFASDRSNLLRFESSIPRGGDQPGTAFCVFAGFFFACGEETELWTPNFRNMAVENIIPGLGISSTIVKTGAILFR